jgi:crotonobetainyl-CoA:carnitine CoA-transferase CaiB-like acyl-CoA transferase
MSGGFEGLIVLEIADSPGACFAGSQFADFNADVIMCESATGRSSMRSMGPKGWWRVLARNKRSLSLSEGEAGTAVICALFERADLIVTDVPTAEQAKHPWLRELAHVKHKPLVAEVFPSGADLPGMWSGDVFSESTAAVAGMMALTGEAEGAPLQPEFPLGDYLAGVLAAFRAAIALRWQALGGKSADSIAVPAHQALLRMIEWQIPVATATGRTEFRTANAFPMDSGISNMHLTRDGKYFAISAANQASAVRLMKMIGGDALANDPRFATIEARARGVAPLYEMLDQWFGERTAAEAQIAATKHDVVLGPIYDTNDILAEPHFPARHNIVEMADDDGGVIRMPGITPRIEGVETAVRHLGPSRGQDNDWIQQRFKA